MLSQVTEYSGTQYDFVIFINCENGKSAPYKHFVFRGIDEFRRAADYLWNSGQNWIGNPKA